MPYNFFVSGGREAGKTTLISKLLRKLRLTAGGFTVIRSGEPGSWEKFWLLPAEFLRYSKGSNDKRGGFQSSLRVTSEADLKQSYLRKYSKKFAERDENGKWRVYRETFDVYGVRLITGKPEKEIVVLDELGRFEKNAEKFQAEIINLLKSEIPVIGVVKPEKNPFLNRVRRELKKRPLLVTAETRESVLKRALNYFADIKN